MISTRSRPPIWPLSLGRGRILIPEFIRSAPTLAVCDIAHLLPLGDVDRNFPFTEDETGRYFSHLSGTFGEHNLSGSIASSSA